MDRAVTLLVLGRVLADVTVGAAVGFALAGEMIAASSAIAAGAVGLALGVRVGEKQGRRPRLAGQLLALAAAGAATATLAAEVGFALCAGAAAIAGTVLGRERADRMKERPRITTTVAGLGGAAAVAHASRLAAQPAAVACAILAFGGGLAAMISALHVGPGRPPPRPVDVAIFLVLGGAAVVVLSLR